MPLRSIRVVVDGKTSSSSSFFWWECHTACLSRVFLLRSSTDGRSSCCRALAVVTNTAWEGGAENLFELVFLLSLGKYPQVDLLDHLVVLFLIFWEAAILFSTVVASIYIPTNSVQGFPFYCILVNACYFGLLDDGHSVR